MGRYVFKLPDAGEGAAEAEISRWHVAVGDRIEEDQPLVDVQGAIGDKIAVGAELVVIETEAQTGIAETETRTKSETRTETGSEPPKLLPRPRCASAHASSALRCTPFRAPDRAHG